MLITESKKDFNHKIGICKKESKETTHWLNMLATAEPEKADKSDGKAEAQPDAGSDKRAETKTEAKAEPKTEAKAPAPRAEGEFALREGLAETIKYFDSQTMRAEH